MENQCTSLIHDILYGSFSKEEWLGIKKRFDAFMEAATDEEIREIEESGAGDTIQMICAGLI
ncbi:MAG: hypothetical protein E7453_06060 [Ruminococcaceae bacterium]|nr:hypothetical protein [Oscillospiraceae bacterium]